MAGDRSRTMAWPFFTSCPSSKFDFHDIAGDPGADLHLADGFRPAGKLEVVGHFADHRFAHRYFRRRGGDDCRRTCGTARQDQHAGGQSRCGGRHSNGYISHQSPPLPSRCLATVDRISIMASSEGKNPAQTTKSRNVGRTSPSSSSLPGREFPVNLLTFRTYLRPRPGGRHSRLPEMRHFLWQTRMICPAVARNAGIAASFIYGPSNPTKWWYTRSPFDVYGFPACVGSGFW